jgi:probable rRNA maturation factor
MAALRLAVQGLSQFDGLPARSTLARWVALALERDAEITLRLVGAAEGRRLNRDFRGRDYPTNVLTFDYARAPAVHADIVLCVPVIRREATEQGKTLRSHLAHLVVHGVLHAQGYVHGSRRAAARMERREAELLSSLRIADPYC